MPAHVKRSPTVPENAAHFTLARHFRDEKGRERRQKVKGEADEHGVVPDQWAASTFTLPTILQTFGAGRYRVDFYDANGTHIEGTGTVFEVANPDRSHKAKKRARPRDEEDDVDEPEDEGGGGRRRAPDLRRRVASGEPIGILDLLAWQEAAAQRAEQLAEQRAARDRADADARRENDRQFMMQMMNLAGQRGPALDTELVRREIALGQRETTLQLRQELRARMAEIANAEPDPDDDDDPDDEGREPPANLDEAVERLGGAILTDLEKRAPHLIAKVFENLAQHGWTPGPKVQQELARSGLMGQPPVNGAARANGG